jgi:hypothetical protein
MQDAIGLLETKGLVALIEATDAMAKAANVQIVKQVQIGGAYATTIVPVTWGACGRQSKRAPPRPRKSASSSPATSSPGRPRDSWTRT